MPSISTNPLNLLSQEQENTLSLNPYQDTPEEELSVAVDAVKPPVKEEFLPQRAFKAAYGLSDILKKSQEEIYGDMSAGQDQGLREQAAAELNYRKERAIENAIRTFSANKGGPASITDIRFLENTIRGMRSDVDPDSVFEEAWGREYINALDRSSERINKLTQTADTNEPTLTENDRVRGRELVSKFDYANNKYEELVTRYNDQPWTPWLVDQLKLMVPGYQDFKLRGNVDGTPFEAGLGSALEAQAKTLFNLPFSEFKSEFNRITEDLAKDNPTLAVMFANYVKGVSTSTQVLDTIFPIIDYATLPAGAMLKGVGKAIMAAKAKIFNENRTAVKTAVEALQAGDVSKDTILAATGDLHEAAISKSTSNLVQRIASDAPDETKMAVEALPTAMRTDIKNMRANPGQHREMVNRMAEEMDRNTDKFMAALVNSQQVDRLPMIHSSETIERLVAQHTIDQYPGLSNRLLDWKMSFENITGTRFVDTIIGDSNAKYFASRETAENFARNQGWLSPDIRMKEGVPVGPALGYTPTQLNKMNSLRKAIKEAEEISIPKNLARAADDSLPENVRAKAKKEADGLMEVLQDYKRQLDQLTAMGNKKAPKPVKTVYVPKAAVRRDWETLPRVGVISVQKQGRKIRYYTDDGAEVTTSNKASTDTIPIHLYKDSKDPSGYRTVIGKPITSEEDVARTTVEQQGVGFYIKRSLPVRETDDFIRGLIEKEVGEKGSSVNSPRTLVNAFIGQLRTPEDTMSLAERSNRKVVTYAPSIIINMIKEEAKNIKNLKGMTGLTNRQRWNDFQRILKVGQDLPDPFDPTRKGGFFANPVELENAYQTHIKRLPDEKEVRAYFAFKNIMEMDRMLRNVQERMFQSRVGAETQQIFAMDERGLRKGSGEFSGVLRKELPGGTDTFLLMGKKLGEEKLISLRTLQGKAREDLANKISRGELKVVELYNSEQRPLQNFSKVAGDTHVRYVITDAVETKPLKWDLIPRRGGGHLEYDADKFIKQAIIKKERVGSQLIVRYEGDQTIAVASINALGEGAAKKLDHVRVLLSKMDEEGARKYANAVFPKNADDVIGWFKQTVDENGNIKPPRLNLETEIQVVTRNKKISDKSDALERLYGENLVDGTKSGSLAQQFQVEYNKMRDDQGLIRFKNEGTPDNPLYDIAPADVVDPITSMNRAVTRIANSNYMNNYKIFSIEHWLARAAPYMKNNRNMVRHSPFWHFNIGPENFRADAPPDIVKQLTTEHMNIQQLIDTPSSTDNLVNSISSKLADSIYNRFGEKVTDKMTQLTPSWLMGTIKDPVNFVKSIAFHANLGLFNPVQLVVQSMNYVNVLGIAGPRNALSGTLGAQLHMWSTVNSNPQILNHLDKLASKFKMPGFNSWKPGEFREAFEELNKTGFANVGREYAVLDDIANETIVDSAGRTFLNAGQIFFKGGERNSRYGAWYTAYKEWREANPFIKIGNKERAEILERADLLNMNMSRASSSMLHRGVLSIPTQFLTYQLRVTELMLSKRLTTAERARLLLTNAAMFGIPAGIGITGFPFSENIRKYAIENGYIAGENFLSSLAMEGIPSILAGLVFGETYNIGDRYAAKGFDQAQQIWQSDAKVWEIFGGAAASKLKDIFEGSSGLFAAVGSIIREDDQHFPMTAADWIGPLRAVGSVNNAVRLYEALQYHKWMTKKGEPLTDVSPAEAIFKTLTGLSEQRVSDITRKLASMKSNTERWKEAEKNFLIEMRRYFRAMDNNDPDNARQYMVRGKIWLNMAGYPEERLGPIYHRARSENQNIVDRIDWQFYINKAPNDQTKQRLDTFRRLQRKINPENK